MSDISEYLLANYYSKYKGDRKDVVPTPQQIDDGYKNHPDKFVIVRDEKIKGIAIFVTLSDETCKMLWNMDITRVDVLNRLLEEHGENVHFVLLCADGMHTILYGIKKVKERTNPKTISWWNPDLNKLHKFRIRS